MQYNSIDIQQRSSMQRQHQHQHQHTPYLRRQGPNSRNLPKLKHGGCVRSFSVLLFVEDTFPQWLHALSE
jgi:hypothetical protein